MKRAGHLASRGVLLYLVNWRAAAIPCSMLQVDVPTTVEDTRGAYELAGAVNCSGGSFDVEWIGHVTVEQPIRVANGTTLRVAGASSSSSVIDGGNETSLFEVFDGTLHLLDLTLANGSAYCGSAINGEDSRITATRSTFFGNTAYHGGGTCLLNSTFQAVSTLFVFNSAVFGGAIYADDSHVTAMNGGLFKDNNASFGGAVLAVASSIHVVDSTFSGNTADDGGSVFVNDSTMEMENTTFVSNNATASGGAIYAVNANAAVGYGGIFEDNSALSGGAIASVGSSIRVAVSSFSSNTATYGGSLIFLKSGVLVEETAFVSNSATFGGAVYSDYSNVTVRHVELFEDNTAIYGGAMYAMGSSINIASSSFLGNTAAFGGGILITESTMETTNTTFVRNNATTYGGAIFAYISTLALGDGSDFAANSATTYGGPMCVFNKPFVFMGGTVVFERNTAPSGGATFIKDSMLFMDGYTRFANNVASVSGGAVHGSHSDINITGVALILTNQAVVGAGLMLDDLCNATVSASGLVDFHNNVAHIGAGMSIWRQSAFILLGSCSFESNYANIGAGLYMMDSLALSLTDSISCLYMSTGSISSFYNNTSALNGGGIALIGGAKVVIEGKATFWENRALIGAAISARKGTYITITGDVTMEGNVASSLGGAIYLEAPSKSNIKGTRFLRNKAIRSGGAVTMFSTGRVDDYATVSGCLFTDNEADDAGGAVFIVGGFVNISSSTFQFNRAGRAGGGILASGNLNLDNCVLAHNAARRGPGIYNTVLVSLASTDVCDNQLLCDDGNFLDWNLSSPYDIACDSCPADGNTCRKPHTSSVQLCEPVLEHTTSPDLDGTLESLSVLSGYWRSSNSSRDIRECYDPAACVGGTQGLCESGYEGPFCAVCTDGYAQGLGYTCLKCTRFRRTATLAGLLAVLVAASFVTVVVCTNWLGPSSAGTTPSLHRGRFCMCFSLFRWTKASQAFKIVIVAWQIVTQFAGVTSTIYPAVYATFLGWVDVVNMNIAWILSAGCLVESSFYHSLLVSTVGPLGVAGIVMVSHAVMCRRCNADDPEIRAKINHQHASVLFWTSFLIYSTVSSSIFHTFVCDHLDNGRSFLRADHSLECYTSTHQAFMAYAGVMVAIYPIGIPACYTLVLYRSRASLKTGQVASTAEAAIVRELWAPYRPQVYYYEVVECFRRVLLSGAVVLAFPNSAGQVATSRLLAMLSAAVLMALGPYAHRWHTWMAGISHAVVILSMYLALLQKVDDFTDDSSSKHVFASVLVALNCGLILAVIVEAFGMCSVAVSEIHEPVAHVAAVTSKSSSRVRRSSYVSAAQVTPFTQTWRLCPTQVV